jgi:hypothetical protein
MRIVAATIATVITVGGFTIEPVQAQTYNWCAIYSGGRGGGARNCYFVTRAQCIAAVSGVGGFCQYMPSNEGPPRGRKRRYY